MTDQPNPGVSRRLLLGAGLAGGAAAALAGGPALAARSSTRPRLPGSLPHPGLPEGTDTMPQIKHIVVLMMENHSYDNKLGMLGRPGADGFTIGSDGKPTATNPYRNLDIQHAFRMPTTCQLVGHPAQDWLNSHRQYNQGRLRGFVKSGSGPVAMGFWKGADQPFYYSLARVFPIADRYFCSVLGQTFPNRRYLISATSLGMVNDTVPTGYPPNGTIFDRLDKADVGWRNYYSTLATTELYPELYLKHRSKIVGIDEFFTDAAAGKLPGFSLVDPNFGTGSEENPQNVAAGEKFAAKVINAVIDGPGWKSTLLIWTYDEHGGYYDHVPPPAAIAPDNIPPAVPAKQRFDGFGRYGFRVPCALVSPWARADYVSHQVFDHTSILALVESKWNLTAMTHRDANASPMLDMLDLTSPAFLTPPALAKPLLDTDPGALKCDVTGPGQIPPPGSVTKHH